jgi:hypothetical protein
VELLDESSPAETFAAEIRMGPGVVAIADALPELESTTGEIRIADVASGVQPSVRNDFLSHHSNQPFFAAAEAFIEIGEVRVFVVVEGHHREVVTIAEGPLDVRRGVRRRRLSRYIRAALADVDLTTEDDHGALLCGTDG